MAYIPPHRRTQGSTNTIRQGDTNDDDDAKLFRKAFSKVRCINLDRRADKWEQFRQHVASFHINVERFSAVDGTLSLNDHSNDDRVRLEWDTTINAKWDGKVPAGETRQLSSGEIGCALSHIHLWEEIAKEDDESFRMLILEDDAAFACSSRRRSLQRCDTFFRAFRIVWNNLPVDWGILYLGLSDRGERHYVYRDGEVEIFRPCYGFHTHAYAVTKRAATILLAQLPVQGPLDVWLADHEWFDIPVYCAVLANQGWRGTGAPLIYQNRKRYQSDIVQSGHDVPSNG